jgi:hypothetical protein
MSQPTPPPRPVAAVFDYRLPESLHTLRKAVGESNLRRFAVPGKPFVVIVTGAPGGDARLAFEDEAQLLKFYLSTLRINVTLEPQRRVQFLLRDLAPAFVDTVREATAQLARELDVAAGPAAQGGA